MKKKNNDNVILIVCIEKNGKQYKLGNNVKYMSIEGIKETASYLIDEIFNNIDENNETI